MGTNISHFHAKVMPYVLVHRSYTDSMHGDTTGKIVTVFSDSLITDVYWFREEPGEDTLVASQYVSFNYTPDGISRGYILARADDKLVPNSKTEYFYTDSAMTSIFSVVLCVGSSLFKTSYKDIYYVPDSTLILKHKHFIFHDLGNGQTIWYESYQKISEFNKEFDLYDNEIKVAITQNDTTRTVKTFSAQKDTMYTTVSLIKTGQPELTEEKITTVFNMQGKKSVTYVELYKEEIDSLMLSYIEFFYYGPDSMRYEVSTHRDTTGRIELTTAENHYYDSLGRTIKIVYYSRNIENTQWDLTGEDLLSYDVITSIKNPVKNTISPHSVMVHRNHIVINSPVENVTGELFTLGGRKIAAIKPFRVKNGNRFILSTKLYAKGQYFFRLVGKTTITVIPVLIGVHN